MVTETYTHNFLFERFRLIVGEVKLNISGHSLKLG